VVSNHCEIASGESQYLGDELTQLPIPQNDHPVAGAEVNLFSDLQRGGKRFRKNCLVITDGVWYGVEVFNGQRQKVGKGPVAPSDAQGRARLAVARGSTSALDAASARGVDFAHDALSNPTRIERATLYDAHEFVTEYTAKTCVTLDEFQVGIADPGHKHTHQCFPVRDIGENRVRVVVVQF
jgi:hypothetical protein